MSTAAVTNGRQHEAQLRHARVGERGLGVGRRPVDEGGHGGGDQADRERGRERDGRLLKHGRVSQQQIRAQVHRDGAVEAGIAVQIASAAPCRI